MLILYSDGITEALNESGEEFGDERLAETALALAEGARTLSVERMLASVDAFAGGAPQADDITCLAVRLACPSL